ncbi:NADH-quinone oxidoreductase subunit J [Microvirga sp. W0021]|uniref:NADH-quinone oxidoreductase subunit J n=1 Tax=Hohaiivirga grylli TaxID=3133970 RepID=A0ABV0BKD7_9HYPH
MTVTAAFFYLFSCVAVASAAVVVTARNPVHSVLFLILAFVNAAGLFILLGAEFLAMLLVIVYVGAVAVLFLFVVMMLDVDFQELRKGSKKYVPIGMLIGVIFLVELILVVSAWVIDPATVTGVATTKAAVSGLTNTEALGHVLYTDYVYFFEAASLILLIAMIGAIMLTHRERENVKRQNISEQVARDQSTVKLRKVPFREGV